MACNPAQTFTTTPPTEYGLSDPWLSIPLNDTFRDGAFDQEFAYWLSLGTWAPMTPQSLLADVLPSALELQSPPNCLLLQQSYDLKQNQGPSQDQVVDIFREFLPATYQNVSRAAVLDYVAVIAMIVPLGDYLARVASSCSTILAKAMVVITVEKFNMTRNCSGTVDILGSGNPPENALVLDFTSEATIQFFSEIMPPWIFGVFPMAIRTFIDDISPTNDFVDAAKRAVTQCKLPDCQNLKLRGNPDIAGIGTSITYCVITGLLVIFVLYSIWYKIMKLLGRNLPATRNVSIINDALVNVWDATTFLSFGVCVASSVLVYRSTNFYEANIATMSAEFTSYASICFSLLAIFKGHLDLQNEIGVSSKFINTFTGCFVCMFSSIILASVSLFRQFDDEQCFEEYSWKSFIDDYLLVIAWLPFLFISIACIFSQAESWFNAPIWRNVLEYLFPLTLVIGAFAMFAACGASFVMFWYMRNTAKRLYGESYDENSWGFGQVLSLMIWWPLVLNIILAIGDIFPFGSKALSELTSIIARKPQVQGNDSTTVHQNTQGQEMGPMLAPSLQSSRGQASSLDAILRNEESQSHIGQQPMRSESPVSLLREELATEQSSSAIDLDPNETTLTMRTSFPQNSSQSRSSQTTASRQ